MTKAELIKLCSELETTVKEQAEEIENPRNDRIALGLLLLTQDTSPIIGGMNARIKALEEKINHLKVGKNMNKVFVYGTLKSGGSIRGLENFGDGAVIVGRAKTTYPDYTMVDLGAFPGVLMGGTKHIQGEVWEVPR